jgi:hypothetical protein
MYDVEGDPVLVPLRVATVSPTSLVVGEVPGDHVRVWEYLDIEFGRSWRRWPAYVGYADLDSIMAVESDYCAEFYWNENLRPYRYWSCSLLVTADDVAAAIRLEVATTRMLEESGYFAMDELACRESSGEYYFEDVPLALGYLRDPKDNDEAAAEHAETAWEFIAEYYDDKKDNAEADAQMYVDLVNRGLLGCTWYTEEDFKAYVHEIEIKPVTCYLDPGDFYAAGLWKRALRRRSIGKARVETQFYSDPKRRAMFNYEEAVLP